MPQPPLTEKEIAFDRGICLALQEAARIQRQRNLDNAVLLAQQAARGIGPLVAHFGELGRRFVAELDAPSSKPKLRIVKDGAA